MEPRNCTAPIEFSGRGDDGRTYPDQKPEMKKSLEWMIN